MDGDGRWLDGPTLRRIPWRQVLQGAGPLFEDCRRDTFVRTLPAHESTTACSGKRKQSEARACRWLVATVQGVPEAQGQADAAARGTNAFSTILAR